MNQARRTVWTCGQCGRGYTCQSEAVAHETACVARANRVTKSQALPRRVVRYAWGWSERALVPVVVEVDG